MYGTFSKLLFNLLQKYNSLCRFVKSIRKKNFNFNYF